MKEREFKVGDKVKIPKTKNKGCLFSSSHVIDKAKRENQDYLFIIRIDECFEWKDNTYVLDWRYDGITNIGGDHFAKSDLEHYEEEFVLPKCWFVLYDTREEFDIINKFYDKNWVYYTQGNTNGYHNNGDDQTHTNNWVGSFSSKEELLKNGYIQITFEQFQKYVLKEKEMEKKIIGYKLNGKVEVEKVAYLLGCASTERDGMFFWETHFDGLTFLKAKELGILDSWFEPVYEEEEQIIKMHSSNKGMFEIEVVDGKAYYRPENKELSKAWVASIIDVFDNKVYGLYEVPYIVSAQIKEVKVGCMEGTRREDWMKVYDLIK